MIEAQQANKSHKPLRHFDLSTLRSFVTIAETGSMTRAASRLFMTQSAISMQIKRLEQALALTVFERGRQGMTPTVAGEQLLHYARHMLSGNDEAWGRLTSPDYEGTIRFGAPSDIIYPQIPGILRSFNRDYPRVQLNFSAALTHTLREQFNTGLQDIVLTTERHPRPGGKVLSTQPLIWTGAENGNAWKKHPLPIGLSRHCAFRPAVLEALEQHGVDWVDIVASDDILAGEALASADLCVSPELEFTEHSGRTEIKHEGQLPELPEYSIVLYYNANTGSDLVQALAAYIEQAYS